MFYLITIVSGAVCGALIAGLRQLLVAIVIDLVIVVATGIALFSLGFDSHKDDSAWLALLISTVVTAMAVGTVRGYISKKNENEK